jgi:multidrug resistance efflux pump
MTLDDSALRDRHEEANLKVKEAEAALDRAEENIRLVGRESAIEVRLAEIDVKLAEIELKELPAGKSKDVAELKVEQAKLKLERAAARAKVQQAQAETDLRTRRDAKKQEAERLKAIEDERQQCKLLAPMDGVVYYPVSERNRFGSGVLIEQGANVREGQKLLRVTGMKQFVLATRVHEAMISSVKVGQAAQVRVDALPDKVMKGKVKTVATVASQTEWMASDVKVYAVTITIEAPPEGLKPDMTGEVQIALGEHKAVLQVPRTAVVTSGRDRVCFVKVGQELLERKVVTGASGAAFVEIKEGLKEGDVVVTNLPALLVRP